MAIYSRSPAAFKAIRSLDILQLPSERTLKINMSQFKKKSGINEDDIRQSSVMYDEHKKRLQSEGKMLPLGEGILIWDETKVCLKLLCMHETF